MTIEITHFPHNEWGYLLGQLEELVEDLQQVDPALASSQTIASLLIVAHALIGHIEAPDARVYVRDWIKDARAYLKAIQPSVH